MSSRRSIPLALAAAVLLGGASPALAQDAAATPPASPQLGDSAAADSYVEAAPAPQQAPAVTKTPATTTAAPARQPVAKPSAPAAPAAAPPAATSTPQAPATTGAPATATGPTAAERRRDLAQRRRRAAQRRKRLLAAWHRRQDARRRAAAKAAAAAKAEATANAAEKPRDSLPTVPAAAVAQSDGIGATDLIVLLLALTVITGTLVTTARRRTDVER